MKAHELFLKKSQALDKSKQTGAKPEKIHKDEEALARFHEIFKVMYKRALTYAIQVGDIGLLEALSSVGVVTSRGFFGGKDPVAFANSEGCPEVVAWFRGKTSSAAAFDTSLGFFADSRIGLEDSKKRLEDSRSDLKKSEEELAGLRRQIEETQIAFAEERRALYEGHISNMKERLANLGCK